MKYGLMMLLKSICLFLVRWTKINITVLYVCFIRISCWVCGGPIVS